MNLAPEINTAASEAFPRLLSDGGFTFTQQSIQGPIHWLLARDKVVTIREDAWQGR